VSPARKRLALVQLQRKQAIADTQRELPAYEAHEEEITARVEWLPQQPR
jgi:cell division protein FtsB